MISVVTTFLVFLASLFCMSSSSSECNLDVCCLCLATYDPVPFLNLQGSNDFYHHSVSQTNGSVYDDTWGADFFISADSGKKRMITRQRSRRSGITNYSFYGDDVFINGYDDDVLNYLNHSLSITNYTALFYIAFGFILVPAVGSSWIFRRRKQKKQVNLRRNLFVRNGGELLPKKALMSIFTAEDLNKATDNYDDSNVLCQEHHLGITYRGLLHGQIVTINFCHGFDRCNIEVLIAKLVSLSHIRHRNLVKLLGCCLETQVPLVVYEFFTVKTLFDYLTDDCLARSLSWDIRLRIAAETAGALACMHSAASVPIIYGSLNSSSILLDHGYAVKVHGFSLSCLECSCVQFYVDPEYCLSSQLTEKSDVYSFGFILAVLLTGKDVMSPEWVEGEEKLAEYFVGGGDLLGIIDDRVVTDDHVGQLTEVAEIAKGCLSSSSQERPTMKEVAAALECIIR